MQKDRVVVPVGSGRVPFRVKRKVAAQCNSVPSCPEYQSNRGELIGILKRPDSAHYHGSNITGLLWSQPHRRSAVPESSHQPLHLRLDEIKRISFKCVRQRGGVAEAVDTPIGLVPTADAIDLNGLDLDDDTMRQLLEVDASSWSHEVALINEHFSMIGDRLPKRLDAELDDLRQRLDAAK